MAAKPPAKPASSRPVVVITGASSGIGRAAAVAFAREQRATVWCGARSEDELRKVVAEVDAAGGVGKWARLDVRDAKSVERFAARVADESGAVSTLVNDAGVGGWANAEDTDLDTWRRVIETNLTGPFLVTQAMLPLLRKAKGRRCVLNIVSVSGKQAFAGGGTYSASKFGLRGWTEAVAAELAKDDIRVTAVFPGYVATPLVKGSAEAKRMIQPEDMATYLVSLTQLPESIHVDDVTVWPWRMYTD